MTRLFRATAMAVLLSSTALGAAQAAPQIFFGEDLVAPRSPTPNASAAQSAFLSNLSGVGTENFEGFAVGASSPLAVVFPGAGTATLNGSLEVISVPTGDSAGRYPTSGDQLVETSSAMTITFSGPVAAFGFFGTDIGDFNGQVTLTFADGSNTVVNIGNTINAPNGSTLFFGYIDTAAPFTAITFGNTAAGSDFFGFDDFTIGSVEQVVGTVPEPMTLALFGLGLAGLGVARRRRR